MIQDHSLPVRQAIIEAMLGDAALVALVSTRIYGHVPEGAQYQRPFIRYGVPIITSFDGVEVDGSDIDVTIHVYDEGVSTDRLHAIMREVGRQGLLADAALEVEDADVYFVTWTGSQILSDEAGKRDLHGIVTFRVVTGQT